MDMYPIFRGERYRNSDPEIPPVWIIPLMRAIDTVTLRTPSKKPVGIVKKNAKVLIVLDLLKAKGIFVILYHGKSPSNHDLPDFVLPVPSILSKSKFWDVGMVTGSINSIVARFCPITPLALC